MYQAQVSDSEVAPDVLMRRSSDALQVCQTL